MNVVKVSWGGALQERRAVWMAGVGLPGTSGAQVAALHCATELRWG